MNNKKVNISYMITFGGSIVALLIGSGFATGQELMQYFSSYGYWGFLGILLVFALLIFISLYLLNMGYKNEFEKDNDIYRYLFGRNIGTVMDYYVTFFIFLSFIVMISGAQATGAQHYNIEGNWFGIVFALVIIATAVFGLERIVDIIGKIGPVIIVLSIAVGVISIFINWDKIPQAASNLEAIRQAGGLQPASPNWWLAALSYIGFVTWWLVAFMVNIGRNTDSIKENRYGILVGAISFTLATIVISFAIFISMDVVYDSQIPVLILAEQMHPLVATIYSLTILAGIYTTAVTLIWTVASRFFEEGTKQFRIAIIVIGVVATLIGLTIQFDTLVNYIYVINGYLGIVFIVVAAYRTKKDQLSLFKDDE